MTFKNVIKDTGEDAVFSDTCNYFYEFHDYLIKHLPNYDDYLFIHYGNNGTKKPISRNFIHPKKVLIFGSGENKMFDFTSIHKDYHAIFAHYAQPNKGVVDSIPLGTFKDMCITPVDINERLYDISFLGCLNNNRVELASAISNINPKWITFGLQYAKNFTLKYLSGFSKMKHPGSFYHFNPDFNTGVDKHYYNYILTQSKIALCPKGWVNAETFRFYEAMKAGCVVICNELPDRWFYKNAPVIQVNNWIEGFSKAHELMKNSKQLNYLSNKSIEFYNKNLSGVASAKYVIKKLNNLS